MAMHQDTAIQADTDIQGYKPVIRVVLHDLNDNEYRTYPAGDPSQQLDIRSRRFSNLYVAIDALCGYMENTNQLERSESKNRRP